LVGMKRFHFISVQTSTQKWCLPRVFSEKPIANTRSEPRRQPAIRGTRSATLRS